jgi:phosphoinositide-3-kinase regulatory subunit 4
MDEDKVDRIVPFVVELLSDEVAIVRAEACRTLVIVVESVKSITLHNCTFIPEYLLPQTRRLTKDPDVFVRATYARALVRLADEAVRMLELSQAATPAPDASHMTEADYNSMLAEIHSVVEDQATALLVDPSSNVKRSLLASIQDLCLFFGRHKSSEVVLSHIMTYLNDRDWQLRLAFFDGIVDVGAFIGVKAVEEYVLPLMLQALAGELLGGFACEPTNARPRGGRRRARHRLPLKPHHPLPPPAHAPLGRLLRYAGLPLPPQRVDPPGHGRVHRRRRASSLDY